MHEILIYCSKNNARTYLKIEHKILNINIFCAFQQTLFTRNIRKPNCNCPEIIVSIACQQIFAAGAFVWVF